MQAQQYFQSTASVIVDDGRTEALHRCRSLLESEGFGVSRVKARNVKRGDEGADLLASNNGRVVRVLVVVGRELDSPCTRSRIRVAIRGGETRLYVPWPLRWRALSNLERWNILGVAVAAW